MSEQETFRVNLYTADGHTPVDCPTEPIEDVGRDGTRIDLTATPPLRNGDFVEFTYTYTEGT